MSYLSLATMIGPWMGPTLIVIGLIITSVVRHITPHDMLLPVIGGSIGGIIATAMSSAFPTYYFIDKDFFMAWAHQPLVLITTVAALAMTAGFFGLWIVEHIKKTLLQEQDLSFPIGKLVYDVAVSTDSHASKKQLLIGVVSTIVYSLTNSFLRIKMVCYDGIVRIVNASHMSIFSVPALQFDMELLPMFLSIGFIAGHMMTVPLFVGALARFTIVDTGRAFLFPMVSDSSFMLAFCSGMVIFGALLSLIETPKKLWKFLTTTHHGSVSTFSWKHFLTLPTFLVMACLVIFFSYFNFSVPSQLYIFVFTAILTYQMVVIAGKIGLAFLGRFATFIMMPGLFIFRFTGLQATMVATFVEVCGGVAAELLFGLKTASLAQLDSKEVKRYQIMGIIVGSIAVAVAFWFLVTHFQLGSEQLFAQRAQGRALIIQAGNFDFKVLGFGMLFGMVLHFVKINSMLVLGGLLMPLSTILPLVIGGTISLYVTKKERFEPLCAGMYATLSIWMIITALLGR